MGLNVIVALSTIINVSSLAIFAPRSAQAQVADINGTPQPTWITVNKYLKIDGIWTLSNSAANTAGFRWFIGGNPTELTMGTSQDVPVGTFWLIEENSVAGYSNIGYTLGDTSCANASSFDPTLARPYGFWSPNLPAGESVFNFCNAADPLPEHGTLTVHKQVDTDGNGSFETTDPSMDAGYAWNINSEDPWNVFGTSKQLTPDSYNVIEQMPSGYHMVGWTYGSPDGDICDSHNKINGPADPIPVDVSNNETTAITICNARDTANVTVRKWVHLLTGHPFEPLQPLALWSWTIDSNPTQYQSTDSVIVTTNDNHVITENPDTYPASQFTTHWVCTVGETVIAEGDDRTIELSLSQSGQNAVCFFHNYEKQTSAGAIHGVKFNDLNGDGIDNDDTSRLGGWTIFLDANGNGQLDGEEQSMQTCTSDQTQDDANQCFEHSVGWYWFSDLTPGTYNVCEVGRNGWQQTSPLNDNHNCHTIAVSQPGSNTCTTPDVEQNAVISDSMCNFGNRENPTGTLTVNKAFWDNGSGEDAATRINPEGWTWDIQNGQQDIAGGTTVELPADENEYVVSEDPIPGYTSRWTCSNDNSGSGMYFDVHLNFNGDDVVCWFYNVAQPTLTITKTDNHVTAQPGEILTYEVTVTNSTGAPALLVKVDDTIPSFVTVDTSSISDSGFLSAGHVIWNFLSVPGNDSKTLTFNATIDSSMPVGTTILHNEAQLGCSPRDTLDSIHSLTVITGDFPCDYATVPPATDDTSVTVVAPTLTITKTNNITTFVNPGATVSYTVVVGNSASATQSATNVVLTDTLPSGFTFAIGGGSTKSFNLGDIAPGASVTTTYQAPVSASQTAGVYTNTATAVGGSTVSASSVHALSTVGPVSATSNVEVRVPQVLGAKSPTLTITKTANPTTVNPSATVTYTVTISNTGDGDATSVIMTDTLPTGLTFVDGGGSTKSWTIGTLAAGAQQIVTYQAKVGKNVKAGVYTNTALAAANGLDPVSASASVTVKVPKVLGLATTGVGLRDYGIFMAGLSLIAAGFVFLKRYRRELGLES